MGTRCMGIKYATNRLIAAGDTIFYVPHGEMKVLPPTNVVIFMPRKTK